MSNYMKALKEAQKAAEMGEIPVGAVIVKDGRKSFRGHNLTSYQGSEQRMRLAIERRLKFWAAGTDEAAICIWALRRAGALVWSNRASIHGIADDPKTGRGSVFNIVQDEG